MLNACWSEDPVYVDRLLYKGDDQYFDNVIFIEKDCGMRICCVQN